MSKKSKWMGEWRKRYLILKGTKLFFSKDATSAPHGIIDLVDCISVKSAEKKAKKRYAIEIELKSETFVLVANNDKEKDSWISKVSQAILDYSSIAVPPPPPSTSSSSKHNLSTGSVGSRSNSSSNMAGMAGMAGSDSGGDYYGAGGSSNTVRSSMGEEDGEEGLLTFDEVPT
mmetsp:Transcript_8177/g.16689  ORF Transcript_8177/g.16689 Transcript_8177/m.16689 type:complete len:173 (+) Transcript_8177:46-564(+)